VRLKLYRRHGLACRAGHPVELRSGQFEESRRGWKHCSCPIVASGTARGVFSRRNTGHYDWDQAKAVASAWEASGWDGATPQPPLELPAAPPAPTRISIADAIKVFLANREGTRIAYPTFRKYRTFTDQLKAFADSRGYVMLDQFTTGDVDVFYSTSTLGLRAKGKMLGTLRAFFRFCVNREWLVRNPVSTDLKPPIGANRLVNKAPFTDEELGGIIKACDQLDDFQVARWGNRHGSGAWTGDDVKDFIWLMTHTGLRISDVVLFDMERLNGNQVFLRAKKNGGEVFAYIPDWLRDRLNVRTKRLGTKPFLIGSTKRLDTVIDVWRQRLGKVFEFADIAEKPTPHRFRHTFARILLQRGVPVADVADLLGDDEKTVRAHYSRWVPERQARLTKILKEAFGDQPKP
jgi:integrase